MPVRGLREGLEILSPYQNSDGIWVGWNQIFGRQLIPDGFLGRQVLFEVGAELSALGEVSGVPQRPPEDGMCWCSLKPAPILMLHGGNGSEGARKVGFQSAELAAFLIYGRRWR